ncbi:MAG: carboxy terminal-processing peptidase [Gammaproteobacteria bacterium]|jgi:carboxyl-terminal processing protease|nr:carboxy terminal-processing peptidase [Gammaproteobacteria bacterium]
MSGLKYAGFLAVAMLAGNPMVATAATDIDVGSPVELASSEKHLQIARMVTQFSERAHYARIRVDNDFSEALLDNYLEGLDNNRSFFLKEDVEALERYRFSLDNSLRSGDMAPVFEIFGVYRERARENLNYAVELLATEPDLALDESYEFDRSEAEWPATEKEMRELWRKRVKNDWLSLILADPDKSTDEIQETLEKRYLRFIKRVNELDSDEVFEGFMNSFARTLDPHSSYMSPRQSEEYRIQMSLSYQGIGASLQLDDDMVTVLNVIPGGPAAIDGRLKASDHIVAVAQGDEEFVDVIGWTLDDVVQLIRGPANTQVRLQIRPGDSMPGESEYVLDLTRNKIKLEEQAAQSEVMEVGRGDDQYKIGVISVPSFYQDFDARSRGEADYVSTTRDVERLIGELEAEGIKGLVLDLRGNGGGHLSEATALSGLFIDNGPIVQLRNTTGKIEILEDPIPAQAYDGPLVVLVDRFSASASEIFAAAIQDYNRGIVIGQQTFGKGTVQNLYVLDQYAPRSQYDGLGQLTLTIGKYYRVTGGSTQNRGVMPDIELPSMVDAGQIGENTKPRALPWDQIDPTRFRADRRFDEQLPLLNRDQIQRSSADPDFQFLLDDIETAEELRQQKSVSLNLAVRKAEQEARRQARLERENSRREARGLEQLDSLDSANDDDWPDVLLNQAAEILTDLAARTEASRPVMSEAR